MIIEFFGFPGSGKTTICNEFITKEKTKGNKVVRGTFDHKSTFSRMSLKLLYSLGCVFIAPVFWIYNFRFLLISQGKKGIKDFLNVTYLYARYNIYKNSERIIIFDQGLIQAYFSVVSFNTKSEKYDYKKIMEMSNYIIVLNLPIDKVLQRIKERDTNKSRIETSEDIDVSFIENQYQSIKKSLNKKENTTQLIQINAEEDIKVNAKYIINELKL